MKKETWVVVANSAEARIYRVEKNGLDHEYTSLEHPESRLHDGDLVTSSPGRSFDSVGPGRHKLEPTTSPKQVEFNAFARDLSHHVEHAHADGRLGRFYLIASPSFLGLMRQTLHPSTLKLLAGEIDKDLVQLKPDELREYLPPVL